VVHLTADTHRSRSCAQISYTLLASRYLMRMNADHTSSWNFKAVTCRPLSAGRTRNRGGRTVRAEGRCMKPPCTWRGLQAVVARRGMAGCVWKATTDTLERRWIEKVKRFQMVPFEGGRCNIFHKTVELFRSRRPPLTRCEAPPRWVLLPLFLRHWLGLRRQLLLLHVP